MRNKKTSDQIDDGYDSTIHSDKMYFYKAYFSHITKEILENYHIIHDYLSQFEREFELPEAELYNNNMIQKIIFDIAYLNKDIIYEASASNDSEREFSDCFNKRIK